jgi:hypothetical protein
VIVFLAVSVLKPTIVHRNVTIREGYVHVLHPQSDPMTDPVNAARVCAAIDAALRATGYVTVMFDSRACPAPNNEVRDVYWAWTKAQTLHKRVAILANSAMTRVSGNMTAIAHDAPLRSFADEAEAVKWLLGKG